MEKNEDIQKQAAIQQAAEDWMIDFNLVTPEYLQKIRMALIVGFPLTGVDVECDIQSFTMLYEVRFKRLVFKGKKEKVMKKMMSLLQERFPEYEIKIRESK